MNIQTLHPNPAQLESERLRPTPEVSDTAANAVTGPNEAPGVTAAAKAAGSDEGGLRGELRDRYAPEDRSGKAGLYRMAKDEEGNPVLLFDGPEKATQEKTEAAGESEEAEAEEKAAAQKEAAQEKEAEESESKSTVTNTDRVDRELQQLREKPGGEDTGISPDPAVGQGGDAVRMSAPQIRQGPDALPPQEGLVADQEHGAVAVSQGLQPQPDGVADAPVRMFVPDGGKAERLRQFQNLRVLGHNRHLFQRLSGNCLQRPADQAPAPGSGGQLVFSEAPGVSRRHDNTACF